MLIALSVLAVLALGIIGLAVYAIVAMNHLDPLNEETEMEADRKFLHEHGTMAEQSWP